MPHAGPYAHIAIFKGNPIDYQKYRHTSIWIKLSDHEFTMIDVTGPPTSYSISVRHEYDASKSSKLVGLVEVGNLPETVTSAQVAALAYEVPPNNREASYNCQTWVGDVLGKMVQKEWLSQEQAERGIDRMIEVTLEAADEPEP